MYRLIVSDLDGTLLNAEHRLGDYSRTVLQTLLRQGGEVVLASGRHYQDVRRLAEQLGGRGCLISSNGAAVHDGDGRLLHWHGIDPECLEFLLLDPVFDQTHTSLYRIDDWLVETPKPVLLRYHRDSGFHYRVVDFRSLGAEPVLKVFYYSEDREHLAELERLVLARLGDRVDTTWSLPVVLEVMAKGVSKGVALARVAERLGLTAAEIIAFGDGRNDLEMLRYAGKGVLMANADPALKEALPHLESIGSNAEEAVAVHLERMFLR